MAEPNTVNTGLIVPNNGDLVGTWGSAGLNPNFVAIDGMFGGVQNIALSAATSFALTLPAGSLSPGAGPNQSQNSLIKFSGTLTGNAVVQLGMPGRYVMHNACTGNNSFAIQVTSSGGGLKVGLPPGQKVTLFHDGTDVDFVDTPPVGSPLDLPVGGYPQWFFACSALPYLYKDGTVYNVSSFPALGEMLGSTFGGNGITTFAVPDERARMRIGIDLNGTGRLTGTYGPSGIALNSAGGEQGHTLSQAEIPSVTPTGSGTLTSINVLATNLTGPAGDRVVMSNQSPFGSQAVNSPSGNVSLSMNSFGGGGQHNNMPPSIVSFLPLLKT